MRTNSRIRNLWIASLVLCIDAWLSLLALWYLPELIDSDNLIPIANSLSWIIALSVLVSVCCCLVVLAIIPKTKQQDENIVNSKHCTLVMTASVGALFLCIIYESVY